MNQYESFGQINLLDEIIVDNFAGGGGASTGMELATGRPVAIAPIVAVRWILMLCRSTMWFH